MWMRGVACCIPTGITGELSHILRKIPGSIIHVDFPPRFVCFRLSSCCGSVGGQWAESGSDSGCYWLRAMSGLAGPHGRRSGGRDRGRGVDSSCWFAPGVLRRLFELPAPVLSRHQLKRLEEHRYSSSGRSLLEPAMQRYWEWLVGRMPPWIAPNLITIVGLATNIFTTLVLVYYCPTATEQVHRPSAKHSIIRS